MEPASPRSNFVPIGYLHYNKAPSNLEKPESIDFPAPAEIKNETEIKWKFYHLLNRVTQFLAGTRIGGYLPFIRSVHHLFSNLKEFKRIYNNSLYKRMQNQTTLLGSDKVDTKCIEEFLKFKEKNRALFDSPGINVWVSSSQRSDSLKTTNDFANENVKKLNLEAQAICSKKVVTVNYANPVHPGGAALRGGRGSQEEALFRDTLLYASIDPETNPNLSQQVQRVQLTAHRHIPYFGGIYSPKVPITREEEVVAQFSEVHNFLSIAACDLRSHHDFIGPLGRHRNPERALYNNPDGTINWGKVEYRTKMMLRISLTQMLTCTIQHYLHNHEIKYENLNGFDEFFTPDRFKFFQQFRIDTINLGALGCGAFENDPKKMAQWIVDVLQEDTFSGVFANWIIPQGVGAGYDDKQYYNDDELLDFEEVKRRGLPLEPYNREAFVWAVRKFGHPN